MSFKSNIINDVISTVIYMETLFSGKFIMKPFTTLFNINFDQITTSRWNGLFLNAFFNK